MDTNDNKKLRDEFAMAALTGLIAVQPSAPGHTINLDELCEDAYKVADGMMNQRQK